MGTKKKPPSHRARVTNGRRLLPTVDGRSIWARILSDTLEAMVTHCGGPDLISEPKRMASRRASVLEVELVHLEDRMARIRAEGGEPDPTILDLYSRMAGTQKRMCEVVGFERQARDITPASLRGEILTVNKKDDVTDV